MEKLRALLRTVEGAAACLPSRVCIQTPLAEGGQGIVFAGTVDGKPAAIKFYLPGQLAKRVEREVEALENILCPSIVDLLWHGSISAEGYTLPVVATSLIQGEDLSQIIKRTALTQADLTTLAFDVATAIDSMWERRIVHRDLKPSNILRRMTGRSCVIDLGLARHIDRSSLTVLGATWGTYGYLSPEQARGLRQLTCKSDVFALGIIILECGLGRHPSSHDQQRLLSMGLHEKLPTELSTWTHADLLKEMVHPRPTRRPKPSVIIAELDAAREDKP